MAQPLWQPWMASWSSTKPQWQTLNGKFKWQVGMVQPPWQLWIVTLNGKLEWYSLYGSLHISDSPDSSSTWLVPPTRDSHIETESNTATPSNSRSINFQKSIIRNKDVLHLSTCYAPKKNTFGTPRCLLRPCMCHAFWKQGFKGIKYCILTS